jgi:hypothetical protein
MGEPSRTIKIIDRHGTFIVEFQRIPEDMTVEEFTKVVIKDCDKIGIQFIK